ncbi:DUF2997 domain-containing protein [Oscillatoria sp. CS-180]|uniref:DUF2997 domain-containing protein n=1 Tax=Oscillatoria sp. CS-180 TaxID=3021720 RepID=UPI0023303EFD|nr:DUF2997 domain-containing protein [Oscillatoria sp. CS-180]MDB9525178.1 DUF2997 domain-containing protein [Oscillatoria sp. CS-180]
METLEFIIYPDGRVKEMVTGVIGRSCEEVTRKIEAQLGNVVSRESTSEYYAQQTQQSSLAETQNQVSYSDWG